MTPTLASHSFSTSLAHTALGNAGRQAQGELFAPALLPRQLPLYKTGPEDDRWTSIEVCPSHDTLH